MRPINLQTLTLMELSAMIIVLVGNCPSGELSGWEFRVGIVWVGIVRNENCPGGNCPLTKKLFSLN